MSPAIRSTLAEFVGTLLLVVFSAGPPIIGAAVGLGGGTVFFAAVATGLGLTALVATFLHVSGAQFNPAVSIALWSAGQQDARTTARFVATQLVAAVLAAVLIAAATGTLVAAGTEESATHVARFGANVPRPELGVVAVSTIEAVATFALMIVIMGAAVDPAGPGRARHVTPFAIGFVVAADIAVFGPITGASMNPARSFGPALIGGVWDLHVAYWIGPIVGAIAAAWVGVLIAPHLRTGANPPADGDETAD